MGLNRHIWCIETELKKIKKILKVAWTDTYDVLKLCPFCVVFRRVLLEPTHMMYWNNSQDLSSTSGVAWTDTYDVLKLTYLFYVVSYGGTWTDTYDVLKQSNNERKIGKHILEPTHMMYWNSSNQVWPFITISWTDTYDVLKLTLKYTLSSKYTFLNRHIWCIETASETSISCNAFSLNRHIWCIETNSLFLPMKKKNNLNRHIWCIETLES